MEKAMIVAGGQQRQRAPHTKSRAGCATCKSRHRRCDLAKPICDFCRNRDLPCSYNKASAGHTEFRFKAVSFSLPASFDVSIGDEARDALEYFCCRSLPVLRCCRPSPLWDSLIAQVVSDASALRDIAIAIGEQQRLVDNATSGYLVRPRKETSYVAAVRSLRKALVDDDSAAYERHAMACLLMCVLESLRGSSSNVLLHLKHGIGLTSKQQKHSDSRLMREATLLLRQHAVHSAIFNALTPDAHQLLGSVHGSRNLKPAAGAFMDPIDGLSSLTSDLMQLIDRRFTMCDPERARDPVFVKALSRLTARQQMFLTGIDAQIDSLATGDVHKRAILELAKARCILLKVYIDSSWTGVQRVYDLKIEDFKQIVDLISAALHAISAIEPNHYGRQAFSIGLSIQVMLVKTVQNCRDKDTRRRAVELLELCPRFEGACDAAVAKAVCKAIVEFEEGAGVDPIPEERRVHHYTLLPSDGSETVQQLRLLYKPVEGGALTAHDVLLDITV